jgi:late competence protein required for DNA uptake (superfamily II DNA/RNA helicase)
MNKVKCTSCNEEIVLADAFEHDGKTYCTECVVEHLKKGHSIEVNLGAIKRVSAAAELERDSAKYSPEAKKATTYKDY